MLKLFMSALLCISLLGMLTACPTEVPTQSETGETSNEQESTPEAIDNTSETGPVTVPALDGRPEPSLPPLEESPTETSIITETVNGITVTIDASAGPSFAFSKPANGVIHIWDRSEGVIAMAPVWGISLVEPDTSKWLDQLIYGQVPDGWKQAYPESGEAPALEKGKTYEFVNNAVIKVRFTF